MGEPATTLRHQPRGAIPTARLGHGGEPEGRHSCRPGNAVTIPGDRNVALPDAGLTARQICLGVFLTTIIFLTSLQVAFGQPATDWQASVRTALDRREFSSATQTIDDVLTRTPADLNALRFRAEVLAGRGQLTNALANIEQLRAQHPDDRRSAVLHAQWLNQLSRPTAALAVYDRWLEQDASDIDMRVRRALVLRQLGDVPRALSDLEQAVAAEPENTFAHHALLRTLMAADRAWEAWRRADELDQRTGLADAELGLIKASLLARIDAIAPAHELASRPTTEIDLVRRQRAFRASLLIRQGRLTEGLELLAPSLQHATGNYEVLLDLGNVYAAADRLPEARACFQRAVELTPQRAEARMGLARLASREGRLTDSLARYRAIAADTPESLEAVLGVSRIARLMNDSRLARTALDQGRRFAPRSIELFQEEILATLAAGDVGAFLATLDRFDRAHPGNPHARLWRLRWKAMETATVDFQAATALLDPFSPEVSGGALFLLANTQMFAHIPALKNWQQDASLPARANLFRTLARQLALWLRRDNAARLDAIAVELAGKDAGTISGDDPTALAAGWWAYVATPFAWARELSPDFDPQAIHLWLAAEVQRRIRAFAIEAESPLEGELLLRRAVWFNAWRDKWNTPEAANSIYEYYASLVPGAYEHPTPDTVAQAWQASDSGGTAGGGSFNNRVTRARWRQERHDYAGALALYRQLAREFPDATEPAQRQAALLRAMGRPQEALATLRELAARPQSNPVTHLEAADLLTRLDEFEVADRQLELAAASGFDEPLLYLRRAGLLQARGLAEAAHQAVDEGLQRHPDAAALIAWQANRLFDERNFPGLADLIRAHPSAAWLTPDLIAAAKPHLTATELASLTSSPGWWFQWQWLPWERLEAQSLTALRIASREAAGLGRRELALDALRPAAAARIPDADLWLAAGRLFDLNGEWAEAERAYRFAHALGLGRPDAAVAMLARRARQVDPMVVAREFAARLESNPDDFGLREGFVVAAIRAGELTAASRALEPLIAADPENPAVRDLAAQLQGAQGEVRQARSLYAAILRGDPTDTDRRDAARALRSANQWGFASGYEFSDLRSTTEDPDPADWQEAFAGVFWQQPRRQSWGLEYRWFERAEEDASQLRLDYGLGVNEDWLLRAHVAPAAEGDIIPRLKLGGGASYRVIDPFFLTFDFDWLTFSDLDVYQFAPGLSWRWHPRSTLDTRVYLNNNVLDTATSDWAATWVLNANWEFTGNSSARLTLATGDESVANPIRGLIGNDSIRSIGLSLNLGLGHKWTLIPAWRYEQHERFDLNAFGLSAVFSY